ncbi:HNH endonuclease signature motif containing protein [Corynebacterium uberis]|uniref:HNH endonuclease signature motif containing protein n=1 Tax=Corynebacterium TaxID=1716 RepID=UPI001D0B0FA6|nr:MULTISPECIES: HNH endonuclease signature motif containing protein [Corynebacterium]MCZ9308397.1 HNH endonuclease [Corynebacterium sp. c6VSa_13]UDL74068.1 HNH endonuclease [Corynebacterium uberis]UDL75049.1 HNH endonuclease [Corynebacterium uberis]UDL77262.1 HNH endonuclease [Corynebacterium uberis]UDL79546.1 HNH endonuclease [Corynebacterium uberis]
MVVAAVVEPGYRACNPDNPDCVFFMDNNERQVAFWKDKLRWILAQEEDFDVTRDSVAENLGMRPAKVEDYVFSVEILSHLPKVDALQESLHHLCMERVCAIGRALASESNETIASLDSQIAEYVTPTRAHQHLPSPQAMYRKVRLLVREAEGPRAPEPLKRVAASVAFEAVPGGATQIRAVVSQGAAVAIYEALSQLSSQRRCSMGQAFEELFTQQATVRCVLNFFSPDPDSQATYLVGSGELSRQEAAYFAPLIDGYRCLDGVGEILTQRHDAPRDVAVAVRLRDGTCRYPHCSRTRNLQLHHVIDHGLGGATTMSNLACLCPHHHNMVTFDHVRMFMGHTGNCHWFFPDGTTTVTDPTGPLAQPRPRQWRVSLTDAREHRRAYYQALHGGEGKGV